jgi:GrpB-like predicted nucleotidyltransferase (UPF0157 family)
MAAKITITEYDPAWPHLFAAEKARLMADIGDHVADIQHIGSTSVPGLGAKPVIDIMVGVRFLADADSHCISPIVGLGYEYVPQFEIDIPFRRYFRKDNDNGVRTHQIHLVEIESDWWERHLVFRDYLRTHPEVREAYEQLKRELASQPFETTGDYAEAKTEFIRAVETDAFVWQGSNL